MTPEHESIYLLFMILTPAAFGALALIAPARRRIALPALLILGTAGNLALNLFAPAGDCIFRSAWGGWGLEFSLRLYHFGRFILFCAAALSFLVAAYTVAFAAGKPYARPIYSGMLFTLALANGAVLANNLAVLLFFWEAILVTMFFMIMSGGKAAHKTAVKALVIAGAADLCMMLGIGLAAGQAGMLAMDKINLPLDAGGTAAFALLLIGAVSKAGFVPFHTWIPDAADDAPLPFMSFLPGALEKLLGIYLLTRICLDLFRFEHGSPMSYVLMALGVCTILIAVMMALIQKDFKRLLSYHAVSQVGYMVLGIGTALPIGIIGGIFHMLNNSVYKCCLFLTAGAVERQTGGTDLHKLGGLRKKMPVTAACFLVAAASIAGFPLTNGFFSKEMVFDGALEAGVPFFIAAAAGAFFTAVSFLKLGHAVFFGKPAATGAAEAVGSAEKTKEAPWPMLAPMLALAAACLALGLGNSHIVGGVLQPVLGARAAAEHIGGHVNWLLAGISAGILILAALDHFWGYKKTGKGLAAADHFHYAPVLRTIYGLAEKKRFDPYEVFRGAVKGYGRLSLRVNDGISWFYDVLAVRMIGGLFALLRRAHNGSQSRYVLWALSGVAVIAAVFLLY